MEHYLIKATIIPETISMIMTECSMNQETAMDSFYSSATAALLADDESGLYGQSPLYIFGLFMSELKEKEEEKKEEKKNIQKKK